MKRCNLVIEVMGEEKMRRKLILMTRSHAGEGEHLRQLDVVYVE